MTSRISAVDPEDLFGPDDGTWTDSDGNLRDEDGEIIIPNEPDYETIMEERYER